MKITAMVKVEFEGDLTMDEMALEMALQRALSHLCLTIEHGSLSGRPTSIRKGSCSADVITTEFNNLSVLR